METQKQILNVGDLFAGFRVVSELGRGNNGVVYLARQELLDREVALKLLLPELSKDTEYVEMLMREARAAARLNHPNIVQALDAGIENGMHYLAMEYVHGRTLEDIRQNSPEELSPKFLLDISIQLADALDYAWENFSMTHGDVKPENMMITDKTRTLKLADLGLAHISGWIDSDDGSFMATPMYVAPEVVAGNGPVGVESDIYSFGVMMYELVAGKPPFRGNTDHLLRCHLEVEPPPLEKANPDAPRDLARFIHRMLRKDPAERPASWGEVKRVLEQFRSSIDAFAKFTTVKPQKSENDLTRLRPLLWVGILIGILVLMLSGALIVLSVLTSRA